jgi:hypothetical protein
MALLHQLCIVVYHGATEVAQSQELSSKAHLIAQRTTHKIHEMQKKAKNRHWLKKPQEEEEEEENTRGRETHPLEAFFGSYERSVPPSALHCFDLRCCADYPHDSGIDGGTY